MIASGPVRGGPMWTARTVEWYERATAASNYATVVLGAAATLLSGCRTVLDVGAGFGALALPLARDVASVTAVEPAPAMAGALRETATRQGLANLTVIEAAWGDVALPPHDAVLCAHVGPLLCAESAFLRDVSAHAQRGVILVRDVASGEDKFFFGELYPRLLGRPYGHRCDWPDTLASLRALGIAPTVTPIIYRSDQPFISLDEACEFWMTYMRLSGAEVRTFLHDFLSQRLVRRDDGGWIAPFTKRAAVIQWRVTREERQP